MKQIMLSGIGGQGVILAANILARSAVKNGYYAAQSQSYGSESRGTTTRAGVVIADDFIDFPHIESADFYIAMAKNEIQQFADKVDKDAKVLYDGSVFSPEKKTGSEMINIEATKLSIDNFDKPLFANIIMLGALIKKSKVAPLEIAEQIIKEIMPEKTLEQNIKALSLGYDQID